MNETENKLKFTKALEFNNNLSVNLNLKCLHGFNKVSVIDKTGVVREDNKISLFELSLLSPEALKKIRIRGLHEKTKEFIEAKILKVKQGNLVHFFVVKFSNGAELLCSRDHKLFSNKGWQTLGNAFDLECVAYIDENATNNIDKDKLKITKLSLLHNPLHFYSDRRFYFGDYDKLDFIHECKKKRITLRQMAEMLGVPSKTIDGWNKDYLSYVKTNKNDFENPNPKILALIDNYTNKASYLALEGQSYPMRVVSIEYYSRSHSYDLEIEMVGLNNKSYHNFFCNSVLVHNSN